MTTNEIRFHDGAAYERYMGAWSQLAGEVFLDWLAPAPQQQWLDVGCGNGAFTQMISERSAPASLHGVDPSANSSPMRKPNQRCRLQCLNKVMRWPYPARLLPSISP